MAYRAEHNFHTVSPRHLPAEPDGWLKVPQNGQVILAVSSDNCYWSQDFDMDACVRRLEGFGFQISSGTYRKQIASSLKDSAIRRYVFFNSQPFRLVLVTIFYLTAWGNIYSTFHQLSMNSVLFYLLVSLGATVITIIIILILDRHTKKSELRKHLNRLYMIKGHPVTLHEEFQSKVIVISEEQPLLSNSSKVHKSKSTFSEVTNFITKGTSEEIARQLLITYSGVYIRLLATGQLPPSPMLHQAAQTPAPCLCQFIQHTVLSHKSTSEYH
ncbi:transmembrane protein 268-like isoform X6 [Hemiscyllium ocellatum]|uniref:transmembrane protein 268-like isoform X6 n=1 Tax=Hemiscyllium ocellatum TaxID=170820 RepID=UPI00296655FD|nr:transmembrane protein 268-like isoform X6 [Hemiscyllium ocellatum]